MERLLIILLLLGIIACAQTQPVQQPVIPPVPTPTAPPQAPPPTNSPVSPTNATANVTTPVAAVPATDEFNVTAQRYSFTPGTITVHQGDHVIIHLTSADVPHGMGIQGYDASVSVQPGETKTLDFVADKAGTFTLYCNTPCGSGHGSMHGTLVVQS